MPTKRGEPGPEQVQLADPDFGPGNVRKLQNLVEQWFAMERKGRVTVSDLPAAIARPSCPVVELHHPGIAMTPLRDVERTLALRGGPRSGRWEQVQGAQACSGFRERSCTGFSGKCRGRTSDRPAVGVESENPVKEGPLSCAEHGGAAREPDGLEAVIGSGASNE